MSRSTLANASPKSVVSVKAVPPVAEASDVNVSRQAARVHRIDGDIRENGGVDGGAQLDLVVGATPLHPGAEVDDRFLLLDGFERVGERLEGTQANVVVERIELLRALIDWRGIGRRCLARIVGRR